MKATAGNSGRLGLAFIAAAALMALALALLGPGSTPNATALGPDCGPHVDDTPGQATAKQLRRALGCLINEERAQRDRVKLRSNAALRRIAQRHTKVMIAEECFKHECPGERSLRKRIEASEYVKGGWRYGYGENLGCAETPAGMIAAWMETPFHRKNIVDGRFRHFGIGGKNGSPFPVGSEDCRPGRDYMTYTVIFGWRKPPSR
jgi:uncharacterized protein YkwD